MRREHRFVCPATLAPLALHVDDAAGDEVASGSLQAADGPAYRIERGLPHLVHPADPAPADAESLAWYHANHAQYDLNLPLTFRTFGIDEGEVRNALVDRLALQPGDRVLETGAGTGRDSAVIAARLGKTGELHVHDLSAPMLTHAAARLAGAAPSVTLAVSNAAWLPYPDASFDAYYHFGGFNTIAERRRALAEICRVVRPGGRALVGDESLAPWLRDTEYGAILANSNPHYRFHPPLEELPSAVRDVTLRYIAGGAYYALDFTVGVGPPAADFDFEIPGPRGGTLRTRYHGRLEGVTPEAVRLAQAARARSGLSMHRWLDDAIRRAAAETLGDDGAGGQG